MIAQLKKIIAYYTLFAMNATPLVANLNQARVFAQLSAMMPHSRLMTSAFVGGLATLSAAVAAAEDKAITDGKNTAAASVGTFVLPSISSGDPGATITLKNGAVAGRTLTSDQLAPSAKPGFINDADAATSGGKSAIVNMNNGVRSVGAAEGSHWGNAYQTVNNSSLTRALYDYDAHTDTFLNNSDVISSSVNTNGTASGYSGCIVTPNAGTPSTTTIPTVYTTSCNRNVSVSSCNASRNSDASVLSSPDSCNTTEACAAYDAPGFVPVGCSPGTPLSGQSVFIGNTYGAGQRNGILVEHICSAAGFQIKVSSAHTVSAGGPVYQFLINPATSQPQTYDLSGLWGTDVANNQSFNGASLTAVSCSFDGSACDLTFKVNTLVPGPADVIRAVHFSDDPTPLEARMSTAAWSCNSAARILTVGGNRIAAGTPEAAALPMLFQGEDHSKGFCLSASAKNYKCHCDQTGQNCAPASTCGSIQSDPNCSYSSSKCIIGTESSCIKWDDTYSCKTGSTTVQTPGASQGSTVTCPGAIRCMGKDCVVPHEESNGDFNTVASALGLASGIEMDSACSTGGGCQVFGGTKMGCSYSAFGFYNCCNENPPVVNIADWVKMGFSTWKVAQRSHAITAASATSESGQWSSISTGTAEVLDDWIYKPITSSIDYVKSVLPMSSSAVPVGSAEVSGSMFDFSVSMASIQSDVYDQAIDFASSLGMPDSMLTGPGGLFDTSGALTKLNWLNNEYLSMLSEIFFWLQIISWILIIYQIIFFDCGDQAAYQLAANKKLNLCVYAGEYCSNKISIYFVKICTQYTKNYCCYNSLLARIVNEQGRPQIGKSWGSGENPDCSGFSADQLAGLDFSTMDLTEYFNSLNAAGIAPANVIANLNPVDGTKEYSGAAYDSASKQSADVETRFKATGLDAANTAKSNKDLADKMNAASRSGAAGPGQ